MENHIYSRPNANLSDLRSFVEFPPKSTSYYCRNAIEGTLCEPVSFTIYTGEGRFKVKVFSGDPIFDSTFNLTINGKVIINNQKIAKNTIFNHQEVIEARNGLIIFTSECFTDCDYAISKLNAIEIKKHINKKSREEMNSMELKLCGLGFKSGKIIIILFYC